MTKGSGKGSGKGVARRASKKQPDATPEQCWAVQLPDGQFIERFSYPPWLATDKDRKAWAKSEGIWLGASIKAIPGKEPFLWPGTSKDSAQYIAGSIPGAQIFGITGPFDGKKGK